MSGLVVEGLSKDYGSPPVAALTDIEFTAGDGSFTAVVGASGSGKSTLLRVIGGLTEPSEGTVAMGGKTPGELRADKAVGWMAQRPALLPWRSAIDNVSLAQSINPRTERLLSEPSRLLELVGLEGSAMSYPGELSGGMQQRVALARTLAIGARLWLMDEPFSSLDELTREALATDLLAIWDEFRPTVVWVTHHIPEAVAMADQIILLTPGPGTVAGRIQVDLPRPRDATATSFQDVVREARAILAGVQKGMVA